MGSKFIIAVLFTISASFPLFPEGIAVTLKKGDTLYKISKEYRIPVNDIIRYNGIKDAGNLKVGTIIKLPSVYVVEKGDTLYGLSKKFEIDVDILCNTNGFDKNHILKIGEKLYIPLKKNETAVAEKAQVNDNVKKGDEGSGILWPHDGKRIPITGKLRGEEIIGKRGDTIVSVSSGRVVWVAPYRGYGNLIMIETPEKLIFAYGGNEETLVKVGDTVKPGTQIGKMGIDPIEKSAKAYFFVYKEGKPVDPAKAPRG